MSKKKKYKPTGRNRGNQPIVIDFDLVEQLAAIHCTQEEIAGICKCNTDTLSRKIYEKYGLVWREFFKMYSAPGKAKLRKAQMNCAINKQNPVMQIFLGKNYLGQTDQITPEAGNSQIMLGYDPNKKINNEEDKDGKAEEKRRNKAEG